MMEGTCRYCGQMKLVQATNLDEANDMATMNCECNEAKREQRLQRVSDVVEKLCGDGCDDLGFEEASLLERQILKDTSKAIACGQTEKVTFNLGDGSTFSIKMNNDGELVMTRGAKFSHSFKA